MTSYIATPTRTMWQAVRDLFTQAHDKKDEAQWERAYRLWVQACVSKAPGEPFMLTHFRPLWLPTTVLPEPAVVARACQDASVGLAARRYPHDERGWQPR